MRIRFLTFVLSLATATAVAQPQDDFARTDEQRRLAAQIRTIQEVDGPFSDRLIEPMTTLGVLYHEDGRLDLSSGMLERAMGVIRANLGLTSLEQAPIMQFLVENEELRGNALRAWEVENELLELVRMHPEDVSTVEILRAVGDKRMDTLQRYHAGELPPQVLLGCYYRPSSHHAGSCTSGSKRAAMAAMLDEARRNYLDALAVLRRQDSLPLIELHELETTLARDIFLYAQPRLDDSGYASGRESLVRIHGDAVSRSAPAIERIDALVRIADWDLLYVRYGLALNGYQRALEQAVAENVPQAAVDRLFSPETPLQIPAFVPERLNGTPPESEGRGHIDMTFEVTRFGKSRRIRILDTTDAPKEAVNRIERLVKRGRFRPQIENNEFVPAAEVSVRYYVSDILTAGPGRSNY